MKQENSWFYAKYCVQLLYLDQRTEDLAKSYVIWEYVDSHDDKKWRNQT